MGGVGGAAGGVWAERYGQQREMALRIRAEEGRDSLQTRIRALSEADSLRNRKAAFATAWVVVDPKDANAVVCAAESV